MLITRGLKLGQTALRSVMGEDSKVEKYIKRRYMKRARGRVKVESGSGWFQKAGNGFVIIGDSEQFDGPRRGVAMRGGCDLPSLFTGVPLMREGIEGSLAISRERTGGLGAYATSQVVQTLNDIPDEATGELCRRLNINNDQFKPSFWGTSLEYPLEEQHGEFPRTVVVMSGGTDVIRTLYRHREHGFVVDPGGWWLNQNLNEVLGDLGNVDWFRKNFEKVGRISIDDYMANVTTIVKELRSRANAEPVIYTTLVVDPEDPTHNYQLVKQSNVTRRREFHIALLELSQKLNFHVVDVDRILKKEGVDEQVDFAHFTVEGMKPVGAEFARILRELEVI